MQVVYFLILLPLSKLPSQVLYLISDFMYLILYHVIGYRRKVVFMNISNSFPDYSKQEVSKIESAFYHHLCDLIVESIKAFSISTSEIEKRFKHRNPELLQKYFDNGQHITMVGGHNNNWELFAVSIAASIQHQPVALFTPLTNVFMNEKITSSRSKFGLWMKSYTEVKEMMMKTTDTPLAIIFGTDQCPTLNQKPYWVEFLNQETAVQFGSEKFAKENNTPVIYGVINKLKRGHYEAEYKLICEEPNELPHGRITELHTKLLEEDITKDPRYWLWTHKRWKRSKKDFAQNIN